MKVSSGGANRATRSVGMPRWTTVAIGLLFAAVIGIAIFKGRTPAEKHRPVATAAGVKKVTLAASAAEAAAVKRDSGPAPGELTRFDTLPNGAPVPELPSTAPKAVSFGVILFMYQGSQMAPTDAPTKAQALERARAVLAEARANFTEAAKKGDRGSTADAGRIPRGVLEPAVEYVLFSLEKGTVHDEPLDTPRGFWVIKRIN
jgi:hypothetical protein